MFTQLMDYRERFAEQHERTGEVFYLTVLGIYLFIHFLYGSLWFWKYPSFNSGAFLYDAQQILAVIGLMKIVLFNRFTDWKEPALFMTTLLVVLVGCRFVVSAAATSRTTSAPPCSLWSWTLSMHSSGESVRTSL